MKTRNGFVSNSSSSSFWLVTTKEYYDEVYERVHPLVRKVVDATFCKSKLGDMEVMSTENMNVHDYDYMFGEYSETVVSEEDLTNEQIDEVKEQCTAIYRVCDSELHEYFLRQLRKKPSQMLSGGCDC